MTKILIVVLGLSVAIISLVWCLFGLWPAMMAGLAIVLFVWKHGEMSPRNTWR